MTRATNEGRRASRIVSFHGFWSTSRPRGLRTGSALHVTRDHRYEAITDTAKQKGCDLAGQLWLAISALRPPQAERVNPGKESPWR